MRLSILLLFLLNFSIIKSQNEGNIWILSNKSNVDDSTRYASIIDFNKLPPTFMTKKTGLISRGTNTSFCDPETGELVLFTNGQHIFDKNFSPIMNGSDFINPGWPGGWPAPQGGIFLSMPGREKSVAYISGRDIFFGSTNTDLGFSPITFTEISWDNNLQIPTVIERETTVTTDTLQPQLFTATRHANGRDWWIVAPHHTLTKHYIFLLDPQGLHLENIQPLTSASDDGGFGQVAFSPDGNWYGMYYYYGILGDPANLPDSRVVVAQFDRCEGTFSFPQTIIYEDEGSWGGIEFSNNNRFLYASNYFNIYQFDLSSNDIEASRIEVATYDGFIDGFNQVAFQHLKLAPDGKIYVFPRAGGQYLGVINQPDSLGLACEVLQHHVKLPTFATMGVPNIPNYNLGKIEGSPCDTIMPNSTNSLSEVLGVKVFPNPATTTLNLSLDTPLSQKTAVNLYQMNGQLLFNSHINSGHAMFEIPVGHLPNGMYLLRLVNNDGLIINKKVNILR